MRWGTWGSRDAVVVAQLRVYQRRGVRRSDRWLAERPDAWASLVAVVASLPVVASARPGAGSPIGAVVVAAIWYGATRRQGGVARAAIELADHGEDELLELERALADARSSRDLAVAERILHADFEETRGVAGADRVARRAWLDRLVGGEPVRIEQGPREVELRPGRAVLSGEAQVVTAAGVDHERIVEDWSREDGRWQLRRRHVETLRRSRT